MADFYLFIIFFFFCCWTSVNPFWFKCKVHVRAESVKHENILKKNNSCLKVIFMDRLVRPPILAAATQCTG